MAGVRQTEGKTGKHLNYRFWFKNWQGKRQWGTGTGSKADTLAMARKLEDEHRQIRLGYRPPPTECRQPHSFAEVMEEYLAWGNAQGGRNGHPWGPKHAASRRRHLPWWKRQLNLNDVADLAGCLAEVEAALRGLKNEGRTGKTISNYAESLAAFCDWCVERNYLEKDPLKGLKRFDSTAQSRRRAMTPDEIQRLLQVAPPPRQLLYAVACATGLRAHELTSLQVADLDQANQGLVLDPRWTKNRKKGFQPLPTSLAGLLSQASCGKAGSEPLLEVPSHTARTLDLDLETAAIPKLTEEGKLDFHAFRTTFATLVIELGANPKEAQDLLRHSTPQLTMNVYARARSERLRTVTGQVGELLRLEGPRATSVHPETTPVPDTHPNPFDGNHLQNPATPDGRGFDSRRLHHYFFPRNFSPPAVQKPPRPRQPK